MTRQKSEKCMTERLKEVVVPPNRWLGVRPWSRHSLVLFVAGLAYLFIGVAYFFVVPGGPRAIALQVAAEWMPLDLWSWVWIAVGVATMISSRWPPTADKWGYMVLTGLSAGWGAFYVMGVIFGDSPVSNLSGGVVWWLVAFMWWSISGLVNPDAAVLSLLHLTEEDLDDRSH